MASAIDPHEARRGCMFAVGVLVGAALAMLWNPKVALWGGVVFAISSVITLAQQAWRDSEGGPP